MPVVEPGLSGLQVVFAGAQPARPIKKSGNELIERVPRPKPAYVSGHRMDSNSAPKRTVCDFLVHESWSEYWTCVVGESEGFRPPPMLNAPAMSITGG